jgi:hypothetical protein
MCLVAQTRIYSPPGQTIPGYTKKANLRVLGIIPLDFSEKNKKKNLQKNLTKLPKQLLKGQRLFGHTSLVAKVTLKNQVLG